MHEDRTENRHTAGSRGEKPTPLRGVILLPIPFNGRL